MAEFAVLYPEMHPIAACALDRRLDAAVVGAERRHRAIGEIGLAAVEVTLSGQAAQQPRRDNADRGVRVRGHRAFRFSVFRGSCLSRRSPRGRRRGPG